MKNVKVDKIVELDRKIEETFLDTTPCFTPNKMQKLNNYDKEVIEYYQGILDLIIEIAKEENIKEIKKIDEKFFRIEDTASMKIESYISNLQFYRNFDREANEIEIQVIKQIQKNLKLDEEFERKNKIELADCYMQMGDEKEARRLMLEFIKENPDEDEAYMCMQNWYMYDEPDINKLAEVIELAEKNNHILFTDMGYCSLIDHYKKIGNKEKQEKYQKLHDKWEKNR